MFLKIPVCPECRKELSEEMAICSHCAKPISKVKYRTVFSWLWSDKIFLISVVAAAACFFMPWFPGKFLYRNEPFSAYQMLLNLYDLDIQFLASYDILRMIQIVPLFSILIFFLIYLGNNLKNSPFITLFLFVMVCFGVIPFIFHIFSGIFAYFSTTVFLGFLVYYFLRGYSKGNLGRTSYYIILVFLCMSVFLYMLNMALDFYNNLDPVLLSDTYGFWMTWIIFTVLTITAFLINMRGSEDFWFLLITFGFSIIAYSTLVNPLFVSGPLKFFANNFSEAGIQTIAHIKIVSMALGIAIFAGIPLGVYITRHPGAANVVLYISSILITIPSIAMFGFMMPILSSIDTAWDAVSGIGIGVVPAVVALSLYSLLPIVRNTYIALKSVDPATIEAGKGMGMTNFQLLIQLQLPLSAPIIMAGVRTAVVMGIAIGAIAAYIGAGGLGLFVSQGLQMSTNDSVIAGAIAMSLLAIVSDIFLEKAEDWITPEGLKIRQATD